MEPTGTDISVIVPCFNEQEVIAKTYLELSNVLKSMAPMRYEILFIDDGSTDETAQIIGQLQKLPKRCD